MRRVIRRIRENRPGLEPNSNFANNANFAGCSRSERGSQRRFWGESPVRWESRFSSPGCSRGTRNARGNRPEPDPASNFANNANFAGCFQRDRGVRKGQSGPAAEPGTFAESARADFCDFCEFCEGVWRARRLPEEARLTVARGERGVADLASKTRGQWMGESGITTSARGHRGRLLDLGCLSHIIIMSGSRPSSSMPASPTSCPRRVSPSVRRVGRGRVFSRRDGQVAFLELHTDGASSVRERSASHRPSARRILPAPDGSFL